MLQEQEIKKMTLEGDEENLVSILTYYFGHKMHLKVSKDIDEKGIEEVGKSIKQRLTMDFKEFKKGNSANAHPTF